MPQNSDTSETRPRPQTKGRRTKTTRPDLPALVIDVPDIAADPSETNAESPAGTTGFAQANDAYFFTPPKNAREYEKPRWTGIKGLDASA